MRLTGLGKIIILVLVLGFAIGGYRFLTSRGGSALGGSGAGTNGQNGGNGGNTGTNGNPNANGNGNNSGTNNGGANGGQNNGGTDNGGIANNGGNNGGDTNNSGGVTQLQLITSPTKRGWLQDQVNNFNEKNAGRFEIKIKFLETRDAMHAVLNGREKPVLWSPSSSIWAARLSQAWKGSHAGSQVLDTNDDSSFRVYLKSPMVWLTTRDKAGFLRPILSRPDAWSSLRALSTGRRKAPYGKFKWAHADPLNANSGFLTMAIILNDYAESSGQVNLEAVANSPAFRGYLGDLERSAVRDEAIAGSGTLLKAFQANPSRYDCITTYESSALDAAMNDPNFVAIYPTPTVVSEHAVAALSGDWVSPQQQAGAREFLKFLGSPEALQAGTQEHLRPTGAGGGLPPEIARLSGQGFKQTYNASELPPYIALNQTAAAWKNVTNS